MAFGPRDFKKKLYNFSGANNSNATRIFPLKTELKRNLKFVYLTCLLTPQLTHAYAHRMLNGGSLKFNSKRCALSLVTALALFACKRSLGRLRISEGRRPDHTLFHR
jgi:hypothetical protein